MHVLEDVIEATDQAVVRRHDVVVGAPIHVEEEVPRSPAWAGPLGAGSDVPDSIAKEGRARRREPGDHEWAPDVVGRLLHGLHLDDAELHVDVEVVQPAARHGDGELAAAVTIGDRRIEGGLDRLTVGGQQTLR